MTTRGVILETAIALFRERGVADTTIRDVIQRSGATAGLVHHHFPQGKDQLAAEATARSGEFMAALLEAIGDVAEPEAVRKVIEYWTTSMRESDFHDGCPAAAATLSADAPSARLAAGAAFGHWEEVLTVALIERGRAPDEAASLATLSIAAIEGALILSRAQRSNEPLRKVGVQLQALHSPDELRVRRRAARRARRTAAS